MKSKNVGILLKDWHVKLGSGGPGREDVRLVLIFPDALGTDEEWGRGR